MWLLVFLAAQRFRKSSDSAGGGGLPGPGGSKVPPGIPTPDRNGAGSRTGRPRMSVTHSQPGSRSTSPTSLSSYATYFSGQTVRVHRRYHFPPSLQNLICLHPTLYIVKVRSIQAQFTAMIWEKSSSSSSCGRLNLSFDLKLTSDHCAKCVTVIWCDLKIKAKVQVHAWTLIWTFFSDHRNELILIWTLRTLYNSVCNALLCIPV